MEKLSNILAYRRFLVRTDENIKAYHFINRASKLLDSPRLKEAAELSFKQIAHILDNTAYKKFYNEKIIEEPIPTANVFNDNAFPERLRWVKRKLKEQGAKSVLDLGCSEGSYSLNIAREGYDVTGVNLFTNSIEVANQRAKEFRLDDHAHFFQSDIMEFETDKKFDAVMLFEVIEHVRDPKSLVDKMMSLTEKDGVCYISTPNGTADEKASALGVESENIANFEFKGHVRCYTEKSMRELLKDYEILDLMIKQEGIFSLMHVSFKRR